MGTVTNITCYIRMVLLCVPIFVYSHSQGAPRQNTPDKDDDDASPPQSMYQSFSYAIIIYSSQF